MQTAALCRMIRVDRPDVVGPLARASFAESAGLGRASGRSVTRIKGEALRPGATTKGGLRHVSNLEGAAH